MGKIEAVELHFARDDWPEQVSISDLNGLQQEWGRWQSYPGSPANQEGPSYRLEVKLLDQQKKGKVFLVTHDLRLFNEELNTEYVPPTGTRQLLHSAVEQLKELRYGQLISWQEADRLLPRYSTFQLMDLETGITWRTQRRAGSRHADIQPLTKEDTQRLKTAYGGSWSWDRRAVVVLAGDKRLAASINGMPHGAGALQNGFPGHHCLHFWQSTTHTKNKPDAAHQVMVHKAAGMLHEYLAQLEPAELQVTMLEMAGQGETAILRLGIRNPSTGTDPVPPVKQIKNIKIWDQRLVEEGADCCIAEYKVSVYFHGDAKEYRKKVTVTSRYDSQLERWLLEPDFISQLVR